MTQDCHYANVLFFLLLSWGTPGDCWPQLGVGFPVLVSVDGHSTNCKPSHLLLVISYGFERQMIKDMKNQHKKKSLSNGFEKLCKGLKWHEPGAGTL